MKFLIPNSSFLILAVLAAIAIAAGTANADIYSEAVREILSNSPELRVATREYDLARAENSTGLSPEDPQIEFGYLWGDRSTGDRKDISVTQSFDFPTVYGRRSALAHSRDNRALTALQERSYELQLRARKQLVQLLYLNALYDYTAGQLSFADSILANQQRLFDRGHATRLDLNKAVLNRADLAAELESVQTERNEVRAALTLLNGGTPLNFEVSQFPEAALPPDFDAWWSEHQGDLPGLRAADAEVALGNKEIALARAEWLPKFSLGYQGEYVRGSNFSGVTVGVSLPLWENRNRVRRAKAAAALAEAGREDARIDMRLTLQAMYNRAQALIKAEAAYSAALSGSDSAALLAKALMQGEITMIQYVSEVQYLNSMTRRRLTLLRDREISLIQFL